MEIIRDVATMHQWRARHRDLAVGLVPTMGYLHEGHLALVERAGAENDLVVVSIYVNPTQFGPAEDFDSYPRDLERDLRLLAPYDVSAVFTPDNRIMYPDGHKTRVVVDGITRVLEGASRPTHFEGVTTIVAKLFNCVQPNRAYFGQKDMQQTVVISRMVRDLDFALELVICPTVREEDGLALSSRNSYLTAEQRAAAPVLYAALNEARQSWHAGQRNADQLGEAIRARIEGEPLARIDYISVANPRTLETLHGEVADGQSAAVSLAVFFGKTRLIDNVILPG